MAGSFFCTMHLVISGEKAIFSFDFMENLYFIRPA
jgi:hypothetical protein